MNILTNSAERMFKILMNTDTKFKKLGTEPYGVKKLTYAEQKKRFENMTPDELVQLIDEHGVEEVETQLSKFYKEEDNG